MDLILPYTIIFGYLDPQGKGPRFRLSCWLHSLGCGPYTIPGPPKEPKTMAQYHKIESMGSIGSIILALLEVQVFILGFQYDMVYGPGFMVHSALKSDFPRMA